MNNAEEIRSRTTGGEDHHHKKKQRQRDEISTSRGKPHQEQHPKPSKDETQPRQAPAAPAKAEAEPSQHRQHKQRATQNAPQATTAARATTTTTRTESATTSRTAPADSTRPRRDQKPAEHPKRLRQSGRARSSCRHQTITAAAEGEDTATRSAEQRPRRRPFPRLILPRRSGQHPKQTQHRGGVFLPRGDKGRRRAEPTPEAAERHRRTRSAADTSEHPEAQQPAAVPAEPIPAGENYQPRSRNTCRAS